MNCETPSMIKEIFLIQVLHQCSTLLWDAFEDNGDENYKEISEFATSARELLIKELSDASRQN